MDTLDVEGYGPIEASLVDECRSELGAGRNRAEDLLLAMEQRHALTPYQLSVLRKGRTDGLVLGQTRLLYKNASGSFARVFRGADIQSGRSLAVKVLRERWAKDPAMVAQFHREAELCRKLQHPNIVPIEEIGRDGDYHFFTMEFVEGGNLRDFISIRRKLSPAEATKCVLEMARGLEYALSMGATHRDLKMTNVLMSSTGVAKLVDFGLAGDDGISGSSAGDGVQRALEYATLEKWTNSPAGDPRTDLYFLGAIYYELLTGVPPYPRTRNREERKQISRYNNIQPIRSHEPNIPRSIEDIVDRLMQILPAQRYQTPTQVVQDLVRVQSELGEGPAAGGESRTSTTDQSSDEKPKKTLPTIMCIESRLKQQDLLRDYLTRHGFRVLVLSDLQRALNRLETAPPDGVILMGQSVGDDVLPAFNRLSAANGRTDWPVSITVLSEQQAGLQEQMEETSQARVVVQPVTLRDLRKQMRLALQRRLRDSREIDTQSA